MFRRNAIFIYPAANLDVYPFPCAEFKPSPLNQFTIGDLHGNALKLIHFLIFQNVLVISPSNYNVLVEIYRTKIENLTEELLLKFRDILDDAEILPAKVVRLIGDVLADRGSNDLLTLLVIEKLHYSDIKLEIIFSNHDIVFLEKYFDSKVSWINNEIQTASMKNFFGLIESELISKEASYYFVTLFTEHIKILSYSIDNKSFPPTLSVYTHAPVGVETLQALAEKYEVNYSDQTLEAMCQMLEDLDNKIRERDFLNDVRLEHSKHSNEEDSIRSNNNIPLTYPLLRLVWSRGREKIDTQISSEKYNIRFVHGHDKLMDAEYGPESYYDNMINLDNGFGKCPDYDLAVKGLGVCFSLYSQDATDFSDVASGSEEFKELKQDCLETVRHTIAGVPLVYCFRQSHSESQKAIQVMSDKFKQYSAKKRSCCFFQSSSKKADVADQLREYCEGNDPVVFLNKKDCELLRQEKSLWQLLIEGRDAGLFPKTIEVNVEAKEVVSGSKRINLKCLC